MCYNSKSSSRRLRRRRGGGCRLRILVTLLTVPRVPLLFLTGEELGHVWSYSPPSLFQCQVLQTTFQFTQHRVSHWTRDRPVLSAHRVGFRDRKQFRCSGHRTPVLDSHLSRVSCQKKNFGLRIPLLNF